MRISMCKPITILLLALWLLPGKCGAQAFTLKKEHDSLYWLNDWRLPYPVYQFQTGDVDGDGREDAMVGVIKATRFYPEKARRLFIFKEVNGKARPMWLGSKLGGILEDFRFLPPARGPHPCAGEHCRQSLRGVGLPLGGLRHDVRPSYHRTYKQRNSN